MKHHGFHFFPFEHTSIEDVCFRQNFSIDSYSKNKIPNIRIFAFGKNDPKKENVEYLEIKQKMEFENGRDYYFLNEIFDFGLKITNEKDYLIYTNSDCHISNDFYPFILNSQYDYIEFFRLEIKNNVVVGQNKDGIDGFAIKNYTLKNLIENKIIPKKLVLGAPYWDAIVSNIAKKHITKRYQDTKRLFHTKHTPRWKMNNLDFGGKLNLNQLNELFEKEIINCRKAEIKSNNLVIRIIDDKTDLTKLKKTITHERFKSKLDFDYNYLFIEINKKDKLNDQNIGTTAGTRFFTTKDKVDDLILNEINKYKRYIIMKEDQAINNQTVFKNEKRSNS